MTDIIPLLTFVLLAVVVAVAVHIDWDWRRRTEFVSAFVNDPHFTADPGDRTRPVSLATKGSTPAGHVVAGGGKHPYWQALSNAPRTAERTTLTITLEGISGGLRDKLGAHDVHTGDAGFDDRYCLRGSDEAVLRGLLQAPAVRAALDIAGTRARRAALHACARRRAREKRQRSPGAAAIDELASRRRRGRRQRRTRRRARLRR